MADSKTDPQRIEYWRKRSYLQTLIAQETGFIYDKDFFFLPIEKVKKNRFNRLFIICLKGNSFVDLKKDKIKSIFKDNELEKKDRKNLLVVLLNQLYCKEIQSDNHGEQAPATDKNNTELYEKMRHTVEVIKNLHWLHGIIGTTEKTVIDYEKKETITFVYFSEQETDYALNFFLNNGFNVDLKEDPSHKIEFSLELPQNTTWPETIEGRPFGFLARPDSSKIMEVISTRLKLVSWEIKNRFRCNLIIEGSESIVVAREKSSRFKSTCPVHRILHEAIKGLESMYGLQFEIDRDDPKSFFVLNKLIEHKPIIKPQTSNMAAKKSYNKSPKFYIKISELLTKAGLEKYPGEKKVDKSKSYFCIEHLKGAPYPRIYFRNGTDQIRKGYLERVKLILEENFISYEYVSDYKTSFYIWEKTSQTKHPASINIHQGRESTGIHKDVYDALLSILNLPKYSVKNDSGIIQLRVSNNNRYPHARIEFLNGEIKEKQAIAKKALGILKSLKTIAVEYTGNKKTMLSVWYKKAEPVQTVTKVIVPQKQENKSWVTEMYNVLPEIVKKELRELILCGNTAVAENIIVLLMKNFHFVKKGSPAEVALNDKIFSSKKEIEDLIFSQ